MRFLQRQRRPTMILVGPESTDGPLSGSDDKVVFFYNDAGQLLGSIGPDPDGAGALKRPANRTTYNAFGKPSKTETGTATAQTLSAFNAMTVLQKTETAYDSYGRPIKSMVYDGASSTILGLSQVSYDSAGRPQCSAVEDEPSIFFITSIFRMRERNGWFFRQ